MTTDTLTPPLVPPVPPAPAIGFFERYLTLWVALCIVVGIALGQWLPGLARGIGALEVARVNVPVGVLIWIMIIPMLLKIDFGALGQVGQHWRGIGVTLFINWAVKPFSMALLLGLSSITVPWATLLMSVGLYIVVPVVIAQALRRWLLRRGEAHLRAVAARLGPWSIAALLVTLVLLFAFQGEAILRQPLVIGLLAVPILIQVLFNSGLAYLLNRKLGVAYCVAGPSALIGASNFFELAVATAISLFGFQSGAALATVVGVLIEVPVMLLVVSVVNRSQGWYERGVARA